MNDIRYALRGFARNPGFVAAAVLSLGIGIGANTAIFSVADALLLRPLPYRDADRLAILWNRSPGLNIAQDWFSTAQYLDIRNGHHGFEELALALGGNANLTGTGEPERVGVVRVSSGLLPMLGARTAMGRLFEAREDTELPAATAILSYGTWMRRYGGDARVLDRAITLDGRRYRVVGVMARGFALPHEVLPTLGGPEEPDILLPLPLAASAVQARNREDYNVIGRLKRGVTLQGAQAEMDAITARLRAAHADLYPPNGGLTFGIVPLKEQVVGDSRRTVLILMGAVVFVLTIACANVANLMLSRGMARSREMAVRAALGAGRARIVRQLLTESVVLGIAGGTLGVALAAWSVQWIRVLGPKSVPRVGEIAINGTVLGFTLGVSVLSGVLFGLAPALRVSRADLHAGMSRAGRGDRLRRLLVVSELALSVVLLIGSGLLLRSFARLLEVAPGFDAKNVLTLGLTMTGAKYGNSTMVLATYRELWQRLARLPGIAAAGGVSALPLSEVYAWGPIIVEGRTPPRGESFLNADERIAAGDYFLAMQIPLRRGRYFNEQDTADKPRVAIVDEYMAQQLWPGQDAIGKRFRPGGVDNAQRWITVVGVVGRVKQYTLDADSRIALYLAHTQSPRREMSVVVRGVGPAAPAVRREIRAVDADLPVYQVRTMEAQVAESLARRKFTLTMLGLFAALALGLAGIGIYGVMAFLVTQGTREIGIRMALGASSGGILGWVLKRAVGMAAVGIAIGLAAAIPLARLLRSLLFGVRESDALTFAAASVVLGAIALAASYVPARRASRIDPMVSLRAE
uniref:ABC transporter permease n=1 Tax=Solibacter usitatus (strain Ellin6076) TaxID=234267 RepID=Q024U8_SOLUE